MNERVKDKGFLKKLFKEAQAEEKDPAQALWDAINLRHTIRFYVMVISLAANIIVIPMLLLSLGII